MVHRFLDASAAAFPDKIALVHEGARVSYGELLERSNAAAGTLRELGVGEGDRVAFAFPNCEAYVELYYGILKAGAVAVPLNTGMRREQIDRMLATLEPKILLVATQYRALFPEPLLPRAFPALFVETDDRPSATPVTLGPAAPVAMPWSLLIAGGGSHPALAEEDEDGLASIIYTSGSTADPKGVMLSHRNIAANTRSIREYLQIGPDDCQMVVLPFYYVMGKSLLNTHIHAGAKLVINNRFTFTSAVFAQMIEEGVTSFSGVPSTYTHLLHRSSLELYRDKLQTLRYCSQAGGHMSPETKIALKQALPMHTRLYVMYGATEASARLTYLPPERLEEKPDSIGIPIPGVSVRILGPDGAEAEEGQVGEIVARGDNIMVGYFRDAEATRQKLCAQGLRTGDMGFKDKDGFIHLVGRNDDMLKIRGHRISPQEIVDALMQTRLISETFVYSVPDELEGGRIEAIAVPIPDQCKESDVLARCRKNLPFFKCPRRIRFVDSLPKFANGKLDRLGCEKLVGRMAGAAVN
jgi:acyl-CoA synthetase (AMP-forming)/AMP-acid ligase II